MNSNTYIIDVQGFKDKENNFILKELALAADNFTQVYLIKPPFPYSKLTDKDRRQVRWVGKNYGITWSEGMIGYTEFKSIVQFYFKNKAILVKGSEKVKWVKELCSDCDVTDIGEMGCPNFEELYKMVTDDGKQNYYCIQHFKRCALKNVICIRHWYKKCNKIINI